MLLRCSGRYMNVGLLVLRIGMGCMFLMYGAPNLFGGPASWERLGAAMSSVGISFAPVFWGFVAAFVMFFGAICVLLGVCFAPACILLTITMIIAAIMHLRLGQGFIVASHAIDDAILFLSLVLIGPGRFSIEKRLKPAGTCGK
jgi:putative oxidoreductase